MSFDYLVELKDITWGETIGKKDKPVIVMFYSPSCPHCQQMDPYFELYSKKFKDKGINKDIMTYLKNLLGIVNNILLDDYLWILFKAKSVLLHKANLSKYYYINNQ